MSRIHEALKKAEQERAAVQASGASVLTASVMPNPPAPAAAQPERDGERYLATESAITHSAGYLRFDDLRKHCAHPQWHLDPNVNVFINPALTAHGSEQFRTLRSRLYQMRSSQTASHAARHQFRAGRRKDVCDQQSGSGNRSPAGPPRPHY